jgi:predicted nucleic acid-binding protein
MTALYLDTSALFAAADDREPDHARTSAVLNEPETRMITSDVVIAELWRLASKRRDAHAAEELVAALLTDGPEIVSVTHGDLLRAIEIGEEFPDQGFSLTDRTSFAVMHRLGLYRVATLDHHFAVYRFGPARRKAFEIAR